MKRETTQTNKKINDSFYKGQAPVTVDEKINEDFYGEEPAQPTSYLGNNTPAIDVTGNKDKNR
ncbi:hypothetical protein IQ283_11915 [Alkalihalobacillus hwajinpoensis]|uniref:hypothetical protein n=1 Tax=Guptibacillus hwajinpoensis TaxID=208199 RepID=UPI0018844D2D|nr:hypothetical protein [Pseudalkalibacillus hwajinpoensis]MBF0707293.1 hypothetical protein [Pseudalkalibacillus hwajinpoensis]